MLFRFISGLLVFSLCNTASLHAQKWYVNSMKSSIAMLDTAKTIKNLTRCAQIFERVTTASPRDWLPVYYNSLTLLKIAHLDLKKNKTTALKNLAKAEKLAYQSDSLKQSNSENKLLLAYVFLLKFYSESGDKIPGNKKLYEKFIGEAVALNANNPRCYLLKGEYILNDTLKIPANKKMSLKEFQSSSEKYKIFTPEKELYPNWGKKYVAEQIEFLSKK